LSFNASLKVDFQGSRIASACGLVLVRELHKRLWFGELIEQPAAAVLGGAAEDGRLPACSSGR